MMVSTTTMIRRLSGLLDTRDLSEWEQQFVRSLVEKLDGTLAIVCRSCNTRHASMPGDSYRDMPKDHKRCPSCRQVKHESEFTADNGRSGPLKRKSLCRTCSNAVVTQWKEANRERYNEYQRQYRAKRKAEGNPVRGGA